MGYGSKLKVQATEIVPVCLESWFVTMGKNGKIYVWVVRWVFEPAYNWRLNHFVGFRCNYSGFITNTPRLHDGAATPQWPTSAPNRKKNLYIVVACTHTHVYIYVYIYIHICTYIYMYIYVHKYMRIYIHISI